MSDLLGISARRMLQALADGETDPAALAALAAPRLRATAEQLCDAFTAAPTLHPVYRRLLKLTLEELRLIEDHLGQLDQQMADLLAQHREAVQRLAEVPGLVMGQESSTSRGRRPVSSKSPAGFQPGGSDSGSRMAPRPA